MHTWRDTIEQMAITEAFIAHHNSAGAFQIMLVQWVKIHVCNLNLNFYISSLLTPCSFFKNNVLSWPQYWYLCLPCTPVFFRVVCCLCLDPWGWCSGLPWPPTTLRQRRRDWLSSQDLPSSQVSSQCVTVCVLRGEWSVIMQKPNTVFTHQVLALDPHWTLSSLSIRGKWQIKLCLLTAQWVKVSHINLNLFMQL